MTKLLYLEDSYADTSHGQVTSIIKKDGKSAIVLDQSVMYPQGGGQPSDKGRLVCSGKEIEVDFVSFDKGDVYHWVDLSDVEVSEGDELDAVVDMEFRKLNARLHTAGHLLDSAMTELGYTDLIPTKGFHFPEGPNVEYKGTIDESEREELKARLESRLNEMIKEGCEVETKLVSKEELAEYCDFVPDYIPEDKPTRIVKVWGEDWIPCGGTHVKNISELGTVTIRKIKCKKGNSKISYELD